MKFKTFVKNFVKKATETIEAVERFSELEGEEKKERLDDALTKFAIKALDQCGVNFALKFIIEKFVIKNIPVISQAIFDLIEKRIKGITSDYDIESTGEG